MINILTGRCDDDALIGQCPYCGGNLTLGHRCIQMEAEMARAADQTSPKVEMKKFLVVPADAYDCLPGRFATSEEATEAASERCAEEGQRMYVVELKAVAVRADRPVKVNKL